ncbi:hypothetical protein G6L30_19575 [Agrobacterium rhizogenes]|nr:hypothetical protein [Rhizobium rhizogenes]
MTFVNAPKHHHSPLLDDDISIWAGTDPAAAARATNAAYGADAILAAALCALCAKVDGRVTDGHFWFKVFCLLHAEAASPVGHTIGLTSTDVCGKTH